MNQRNHKRQRKKPGLPPGSLVFTGKQNLENAFVSYIEYSPNSLKENNLLQATDIKFSPSKEQVTWYDVRGLHDTSLIELLGLAFNIHTLVLEDVVDIHQRPKFDEYETGISIIIKALDFNTDTLKITTEQVAIYFNQDFLISFQETESDLFEAIRHRLKNTQGKIRNRRADFLAYALLDNIIDHYYIVLDKIEEVIENLEDEILSNPDNTIKAKIHHLKKELLVVRKSINPLRETIARFSKSDNPLIQERSTIFIRDMYDHTIQVMDMVESYRDMLNGLQDLYLSEISFKMNQVMQVLTVITTIFVPLSFLAGLYGMNFEYIPELHYKYGYFTLLGVMFIIFLGSLFYFKKKKWF